MAPTIDEPSSLVDIIRQVPLFADLSDVQVAELGAASRRVAAPAGTLVIREGDRGDALLIILSGELEITKHDNDREITLATRKAGEILGEMSLLEQWPRTASARATSDTDLLEVDSAAIRRVLEVDPKIATAILKTMAGRLRSTEASLMQHEKLASLGTLAAGLAHELNNPSAAIQRSTSYLRAFLDASTERNAALAELPLSGAERQQLALLRNGFNSQRASPAAAADEDQVIARLEALGVAEPWEVGPPLAAAGWSVEAIDVLGQSLSASHRSAILAWLGAELGARQLLDEIQRSGKAISDIVRGVKSYAYLDQASIQNVDVATTLEDTLMILRHKLGHIEVVRDYQPGLPRIEVHAGELNQVCTTLIENSIDAICDTC